MLRGRNLRGGRRRVWRVVRAALALLLAVVLIPVVVALVGVGVECRPWSSGPEAAAPAPAAATAALAGYARPEDQTYLTLPEWYIVYSSDEYAAYIKDHPPSGFPYFRAIGQFWGSYYDVCGVTRARYAFNGGYHLSLAVIGISFTVENTLKGLYENTVGRFTELISSRALTPEDAYARTVAAEYGTFLHTIPWYEFPFSAKLRGLWAETPFFGRNLVRKAERKTALSAEYGTKALYGWLIGLGTQGVYSAEDLEIDVWATGITPALLRAEPDVKVAKQIDAGTAILVLPRYEAFTQIVPRLTAQGVRFVEIAGNHEILVTAFAPRDWQGTLAAGQPLFALPILTEPARERLAITVPVAELHTLLAALTSGGELQLEHIYDY